MRNECPLKTQGMYVCSFLKWSGHSVWGESQTESTSSQIKFSPTDANARQEIDLAGRFAFYIARYISEIGGFSFPVSSQGVRLVEIKYVDCLSLLPLIPLLRTLLQNFELFLIGHAVHPLAEMTAPALYPNEKARQDFDRDRYRHCTR